MRTLKTTEGGIYEEQQANTTTTTTAAASVTHDNTQLWVFKEKRSLNTKHTHHSQEERRTNTHTQIHKTNQRTATHTRARNNTATMALAKTNAQTHNCTGKHKTQDTDHMGANKHKSGIGKRRIIETMSMRWKPRGAPAGNAIQESFQKTESTQ